MLRFATVLLAVLPAIHSQFAQAQSDDVASANYVMPGCRGFMERETRNTHVEGTCNGIVRAMFFFGSTNLGFCPPKGATVGQAVRVIIAYVDQRPAQMHLPFEVLALRALTGSWPCK